jgi:hypothetical protein
MLPLDTVKSQAPLAPKVEVGDKADAKPGEKKADASDAAKEAAPVEEAAPAPADKADEE